MRRAQHARGCAFACGCDGADWGGGAAHGYSGLAGFLMAAANDAGDTDLAFRFRVLAAEAANKYEAVSGAR